MKPSTILEIAGTCISFVGSIIGTVGDDVCEEKFKECVAKIKPSTKA